MLKEMAKESSSHESSSRQQKQRAPVEDDVLTEGSEEDMEDDMLTGALYTRDGMPLCEALVYIATSIANLSNNIQTTADKNLRLTKFIAKQLQIISGALVSEQEDEEEHHDDEANSNANSTAAQIDGAPTDASTVPSNVPEVSDAPSPSKHAS